MAKDLDGRVVVVAQLVERSLPTPEIHGSNPNIGKILSTNYTLNEKRRKWEKRGTEWPVLKKIWMGPNFGTDS